MYTDKKDVKSPETDLSELDSVTRLILKKNGIQTLSQLVDTPVATLKDIGPITKVKINLFLKKKLA